LSSSSSGFSIISVSFLLRMEGVSILRTEATGYFGIGTSKQTPCANSSKSWSSAHSSVFCKPICTLHSILRIGALERIIRCLSLILFFEYPYSSITSFTFKLIPLSWAAKSMAGIWFTPSVNVNRWEIF
jgi:hypothetical protein